MAITRPTLTDSTSPSTGDILNAAFFTDLYDRVDALIGNWTDVAFSAGNFTANGSQTWTLASGDQITFKYQKTGKRMLVVFALETTTVGGTPNTDLLITIPGGFTAQGQHNAHLYYIENGTHGDGMIQINGGGATTMRLLKASFANWTGTTNTTSVYGQIMFETTT